MKLTERNTLLAQAIFLFILGFSLYANTLSHSWASDDTLVITENRFTKDGLEGIKKIWTSDSFDGFFDEGKNLLPGGRYRPLSQTIFNVQYTLMGGELNPSLGHLTNVILFPIAIILLFLFLTRLFKNHDPTKGIFSIAFIASLLIAAHPLNTEVVANIKSLDFILSMIFSVAVLWLSVLFVEKSKYIYLFGIFICYLFGILAKESTATLFLLSPITLLFFRNEHKKKIWMVLITLAVGFASYSYIRYLAIGAPKTNVIMNELLNNPYLEASNSEKYATIFYSWFIYLKLLIFPHPLTHDYYPYHIEITNWENPASLIAFVLFVGLSILSSMHIWKLIKNKNQSPNIYLYGFLFFLITFSVSSNLAFNVGAFMNERFVFFASVGFALILAMGIKYITRNTKGNVILILLILVFLIPYSAKTITRNKVWKDDFTLFTTDVKTSKNSAKCNVSAGGSYYEAAKELNGTRKRNYLNLAFKYVSRGAEIHPKNSQAWLLMCQITSEQNNYDYCSVALENYLRLTGSNATTLENAKTLALMAHRDKAYKSSLEMFMPILSNYNNDPEILFIISDNYLNTNEVNKAIEINNNLISKHPTFIKAYNKLGEIYGKYLNDLSNSEFYLRKAYEIDPKNSSVLENLGVLMGVTEKYEASLKYLEEALKNGGESKLIYQNMSLTHRNLGNLKLAKEYELKAAQIK